MEKKNLSISLVIIMAVSFANGLEQNNIQNFNEDLIFEFSFSEPIIEQVEINNEIVNRISLEDLKNTNDYNQPCLPVKTVKILLPYQRDVEKIKIITSDKIPIKKDCKIELAGKLIPIIDIDFVREEKNLISKNNKPTNKYIENEQIYSNIGTYICKGFRILFVNIYPVQYNEKNDELYYYNNVILTIETKESPICKSNRGLAQDLEYIKQIVDNPPITNSYNEIIIDSQTKTSSYGYIIITTEEFKNAQGDHTFQDLIYSKLEKGMTAKIFTIEEIISNPDYI